MLCNHYKYEFIAVNITIHISLPFGTNYNTSISQPCAHVVEDCDILANVRTKSGMFVCYIENTRRVSFDINFTRHCFENAC